jgi:cytochrome c
MHRQVAGLFAALACVSLAIWAARSSPDQSVEAEEVAASAKQDKCWDPSAAVKPPKVCDATLADPQISCYLPKDVEGELRQKNLNVVQRASDIFSWQEFMALNWPARPGDRGEPDDAKSIGDPGPRVWETWEESYEVYLPGGVEPPDWNAPQKLPAGCNGSKLLARRQKVDDVLDERTQAVKANATLPATLTDQRGRLVRYEIRMNKVLFDFIGQRGLYNGAKQAQADSVSLPDGAMLIKASWREVEPADEARFFTTEACVCDLVQQQPANCRTRRMGLVGLHIMQKTPAAPQWIWSTFEQVDNVTGTAGADPSFHNPYCRDCPPNRQTTPGTPNQVTRVIPIPSADPDCADPNRSVDNVREMNRAMQRALAERKSVFQHYELINTQWPVRPQDDSRSTPDTVFRVRPTFLGNTTMETFVQDTSSCMGCHMMARTVRTDRFVSSDFSFTLNNALPTPPNTQVIPPPKQPVTGWDNQNWNSVLRGFAIAEQTYELLPQFVGSKLHCASCHLNAGGNPDAAWWVGMIDKHQYPATNNLQNRINQCFERSENGQPLCSTTPPNTCNDDPNMNALITYMQWLDEQYQATRTGPPANGFPKIPTLTGDPGRGHEIFLQKCSFCHGLDGQGRYESDTYFRPALWGRHSFNASAGMATPATLAAFAKSNMPFGSGGLLTDQEAWDLVAFIDGQKRPGK